MRTAVIAGVLAGWTALLSTAAWAYSPRTLIRPTGVAPGDNLGLAVSGAGDVNGDGYDDLIVGAPLHDAAGLNAGRAYIYYGGPEVNAVPDVTLTGQAAGDTFGASVSGAGDMNGDGYDDVIVGAPWNAAAGVQAGRAYVYYGGPSMDAVADLTLTGEAASDNFGAAVSKAGDVNGDGYADVIVGAWGAAVDAGQAYIFHGGPVANAVADWNLTHNTFLDFFGLSVSGAGDVNGDGYDDVIVGAPGSDLGGNNKGQAFVYYGGTVPNVTADLTFNGSVDTGEFGWSVSGAGDMNGDGYDDVIIGAPGTEFDGIDQGIAFVYYCGPAHDLLLDMYVVGDDLVDKLGYSVAGAGDVNQDGFDDVIIGSPGNDNGGQNAGRAKVYYGGLVDLTADIVMTNREPSSSFGTSVAAAGDMDGDGYPDLVVGAHLNDAEGLDAGMAEVISSRPFAVRSPNGGEQWVSRAAHPVRWLGSDPADLWISYDGGVTYALLASGVGRLKENEFQVTAPNVMTDAGKVRVSVMGEPLTHATSDASDGVFSIVAEHDPPAAAHRLQRIFAGASSEDALGASVSDAGDMNGDGYADVIVGAHMNDAGGSDAGRAYVYYGGPAADAIADLTLTGETAGDNFGISVSGAGDVNGDGYADVIVGAWASSAGASNGGRAYLYFGGPGADSAPDLILTGSEVFGAFGFSVSGAGDVNGDGYADFVVGAFAQNGGVGRAHVYFGGIALDAGADLILNGEAGGDGFGLSVSGAGDVNGDGYADVIVGAYANDAAGPSAGRAYVYYGGPGGNAVVDLILTGAAENDDFGYSVSGAGDVNGDGFADVIVGALLHDSGATDAGRAYVYLGGRAMDGVADWTLTGQSASEQLGISVSGAGDVNDDGFADVIVGANGNDALGLDTGRAYVYYGGPGADAVADHILTGPFEGSLFGISVSGAGDGNGDGHGDVIVGAVNAVPGGLFAAGQVDLYDLNRYHVTTPNGGETLNVGARKTLSWLGAEPANVLLSVDGGQSYTSLTSGPVGGSASNSITVQIPHTPTKFAKIRVIPHDSQISGADQSDSLFTIQTSVALLSMLAAPLPEGAKGAMISWQTDPGPDDLSGYRLERSGSANGSDWHTIIALTRETSHTDPEGGPGSRYRLFAVNGLGEELWLGEAAIRPLTPLSAWPLPYRGGPLTVSFATGGFGGGAGRTELSVYDVSGRLVRRIDSDVYPAGYRIATWDGRDEHAREVAPGVYFLHAKGDFGYRRTMKISVLR